MATLKELKNMVQEIIDKGATTVEEVHQAIASRPFHVLEQLVPDAAPIKSIEEIQKKTIGNVYDTIRLVNKTVGDIAENLLEQAEGRAKEGEEAPGKEPEGE